jgi:hypothetical protein
MRRVTREKVMPRQEAVELIRRYANRISGSPSATIRGAGYEGGRGFILRSFGMFKGEFLGEPLNGCDWLGYSEAEKECVKEGLEVILDFRKKRDLMMGRSDCKALDQYSRALKTIEKIKDVYRENRKNNG